MLYFLLQHKFLFRNRGLGYAIEYPIFYFFFVCFISFRARSISFSIIFTTSLSCTILKSGLIASKSFINSLSVLKFIRLFVNLVTFFMLLYSNKKNDYRMLRINISVNCIFLNKFSTRRNLITH